MQYIRSGSLDKDLIGIYIPPIGLLPGQNFTLACQNRLGRIRDIVNFQIGLSPILRLRSHVKIIAGKGNAIGVDLLYPDSIHFNWITSATDIQDHNLRIPRTIPEPTIAVVDQVAILPGFTKGTPFNSTAIIGPQLCRSQRIAQIQQMKNRIVITRGVRIC